MDVRITVRSGDVTDRLKSHVETAVGKLAKFDRRVSAADIIFTEEKKSKKVEGILHTDGDDNPVAKAEGSDFKSAFDNLVDKLSKILRRRRDAQRSHRNDEKPVVPVPEEVLD